MATMLQLLQALNRGGLPPLPGPAKPVPIPYAPVGNLGPLSDDTTAAFGALNPEPVPPAPSPPPPTDMNFVNSYAGAAPTAPTLNEPTTLDKLAAILGGIAGGPGYAQALRAERERPMQEFQRQNEQYQDRRTRGLEIAERRAEREQDRAQRAAEQRYEREFNTWVKKTGVRDEQAKTLMRQAFELNVIRERERVADEKQQKTIEAATEKQRRDIEDELASKDGAPPSIAREISEYRVGKRPSLSAAAERWRGLRAQKLQAQLARVGGGGAASPKTFVEVRDGNGNVSTLPLTPQVNDLIKTAGLTVERVLTSGGSAQPAATSGVSGASPEGFPLALGAPGGPKPFQAPAEAPKISRGKAKAKLVKGGYSSKEADQELNRLGIK